MSNKSFAYLRKGEGISRFGKIRYPKFGSSKNSNFDGGTQNSNFDGGMQNSNFAVIPSSSSDSGKGTVDSVPDDIRIYTKRKGIFDGGDNSADASLLDFQQMQLEKDSFETRRFEFIEKLTENLSLNSDSSFYQRLLHDDNFIYGDGRQILREFQNFNAENADEKLDEGYQLPEHHRLSTVREVSDENLPCDDENVRIRPNVIFNDDAFESNSNGTNVPGTSNFDFIAERFPPFSIPSFLPPFLKQQIQSNNGPPRSNTQPESTVNEKKLLELGKKLEAAMNVLSKDAEKLEILKKNLEQKERLFESNSLKFQSEKHEFQKEKREFDVFVAEEMKKIDKDRSILSKEKGANQKKQNEQISLLRQQILDLQNDMCERESRFSGSRAKIRQLEVELSAAKEENELLRVRCRHLEDNTTKLDKENAQLRCKNWSLKENIQLEFAGNANKTVATSKPTILANASTSKSTNSTKSVRFLLPDEAPMFQRTEDRCVQTSDPSEMSTQTSIVVDTPRPFASASTSRTLSEPSLTSCFNVLTDANRQTLERRRSDGSKEIIHPNGTLEEVNAEGLTMLYNYPNGDTRKFESNGIEIYHFSSSNITQMRHPSGLTVVRYKDGREEKHFVDGRVEITTPDRVKRTVSPRGTEMVEYPDGTSSEQTVGGPLIVSFKDGSKETRTAEYSVTFSIDAKNNAKNAKKFCMQKREFPSGDVKFRYKDGSEETRLVSGRVRIKDSKGKIIKDEQVKDIIIR